MRDTQQTFNNQEVWHLFKGFLPFKQKKYHNPFSPPTRSRASPFHREACLVHGGKKRQKEFSEHLRAKDEPTPYTPLLEVGSATQHGKADANRVISMSLLESARLYKRSFGHLWVNRGYLVEKPEVFRCSQL